MDTLSPPHDGDHLASSGVEEVAAVVALKTLPAAKSRLSSLPAPLRERLARCMAIDTIAALAPAVQHIVVVSDQPDLSSALGRWGLEVRVLPEPADTADPELTTGRGSLNRALDHADRLLRAEGIDAVLACVGDLPALRTGSVRRVVAASRDHHRCFLADREGVGSTMLVGRGVPLNPLYGTEIVTGRTIGSAVRHRRSGAVALELGDLPDARGDVDTLADLAVAGRRGVGPATALLLDPVTEAPGRYLPAEVLERDATGFTVLTEGHPEHVALPAYDGDPALLVPGRRLHAVRVADVLRCWT